MRNNVFDFCRIPSQLYVTDGKRILELSKMDNRLFWHEQRTKWWREARRKMPNAETIEIIWYNKNGDIAVEYRQDKKGSRWRYM